MIRVDIHTHILPGIDDGSRNVAESLQMLKILADSAVSVAVATPHFYAESDHPLHFLKRREHAANILTSELSGKLAPHILLGAEVAYFEGIHTCEYVKELAIQNTRLLLVELPMCQWTERMFFELTTLLERRGLVPVIAHLDRYRLSGREMTMVKGFVRDGGLVQLNADSFLSWRTARKSKKLLIDGTAQLIGSDCHNMQTRPPRIGQVCDEIEKIKKGNLPERMEHTLRTFFPKDILLERS